MRTVIQLTALVSYSLLVPVALTTLTVGTREPVVRTSKKPRANTDNPEYATRRFHKLVTCTRYFATRVRGQLPRAQRKDVAIVVRRLMRGHNARKGLYAHLRWLEMHRRLLQRLHVGMIATLVPALCGWTLADIETRNFYELVLPTIAMLILVESLIDLAQLQQPILVALVNLRSLERIRAYTSKRATAQAAGSKSTKLQLQALRYIGVGCVRHIRLNHFGAVGDAADAVTTRLADVAAQISDLQYRTMLDPKDDTVLDRARALIIQTAD